MIKEEMFEAWTTILKIIHSLVDNVFITPKKQIRKVVTIFDTLTRIIEETPAERVTIFKASNGGGIIKPSGEIFLSILYENYTHPFASSKDDFQNIQADKETTRLLLQIMQERKVKLVTATMKKSFLKDTYQAMGIASTVVYYVKQDKRNIYFATCNVSHNEDFSNTSHLDTLINIIRQNIK